MQNNISIPNDILKIQSKMCSFKTDSRNYNKYKKILAKHIKNYNIKKRVLSDIETINKIKELEKSN